MPNRPKRFRPSDGQKPKPAAKPADRSRGLSSNLNHAWVEEIFNSSTYEEITALLRRVRYPLQRTATGSNNRAVAAAQAHEVLDLLRSPEGQRQLKTKKEQALEREVRAWVMSATGKETVRKLRDRLLSENAAEDDNVLEQASRKELAVRVERWLQSPAGREALEIQRSRALQDKVGSASPKKPSWVDREVGGSGCETEL